MAIDEETRNYNNLCSITERKSSNRFIWKRKPNRTFSAVSRADSKGLRTFCGIGDNGDSGKQKGEGIKGCQMLTRYNKRGMGVWQEREPTEGEGKWDDSSLDGSLGGRFQLCHDYAVRNMGGTSVTCNGGAELYSIWSPFAKTPCLNYMLCSLKTNKMIIINMFCVIALNESSSKSVLLQVV